MLGEAGHDSGAYGVPGDKYDGDGLGCRFHGQRRGGTSAEDQVRIEAHKFLRQARKAIVVTLRPPVLDDDIPALHVPELAQPSHEALGLITGRRRCQTRDEPDPPNLSRRLRVAEPWRGEDNCGENHDGDGASLHGPPSRRVWTPGL